jgi:hypothetical protein
MRIFGDSTVDYWPSTGRAWLLNSSEKAMDMTPEEAVALAIGTYTAPEEMLSLF